MINLASLCFVLMLSLNPDGSVSLSNDSYSGGPLPEGVSIVDSNYSLPASPEYLTHSNGVVLMRSQSEIDIINAAKVEANEAELDQKAIESSQTPLILAAGDFIKEVVRRVKSGEPDFTEEEMVAYFQGLLAQRMKGQQ